MESRPAGPLDAMRRPGPSELLEVFRHLRMPVPREDDGQASSLEQGDRPIRSGNDRVPARHPKGASGTEVVLDVDYEQFGPLTIGPTRVSTYLSIILCTLQLFVS